MNKKVAIVQSCYVPWKGYFDLINSADTFILYDDVQYTKNDWRNRNLILTPQGVQWLTIPVHGGLDKQIKEVCVANHYWPVKHWKTLQANYSKSAYFKQYAEHFERIYFECRTLSLLSHINYKFIELICGLLNIKTKLTWSMDHAPERIHMQDKTARVIALCKSVNANSYISGPSAMNYINEEKFHREEINIRYIDYSDYLPYRQLYGQFTHYVSILDLLFNHGPHTPKYMKSF